MEESNEKVSCVCGSSVLKKNIKAHEKTLKHLKALGLSVPTKERPTQNVSFSLDSSAPLETSPNPPYNPEVVTEKAKSIKLNPKEGWLVNKTSETKSKYGKVEEGEESDDEDFDYDYVIEKVEDKVADMFSHFDETMTNKLLTVLNAITNSHTELTQKLDELNSKLSE